MMKVEIIIDVSSVEIHDLRASVAGYHYTSSLYLHSPKNRVQEVLIHVNRFST